MSVVRPIYAPVVDLLATGTYMLGYNSLKSMVHGHTRGCGMLDNEFLGASGASIFMDIKIAGSPTGTLELWMATSPDTVLFTDGYIVDKFLSTPLNIGTPKYSQLLRTIRPTVDNETIRCTIDLCDYMDALPIYCGFALYNGCGVSLDATYTHRMLLTTVVYEYV